MTFQYGIENRRNKNKKVLASHAGRELHCAYITYIYIHTYIHIFIDMHTVWHHWYVYMYVCMYVCMLFTYVRVYMYIRTFRPGLQSLAGFLLKGQPRERTLSTSI